MSRERLTDEQKAHVLAQAEAGIPIDGGWLHSSAFDFHKNDIGSW